MKEKFENHPVGFGIIMFALGVSTNLFHLSKPDKAPEQTTIVELQQDAQKFIDDHNARMEQLHAKYREYEDEAASSAHIDDFRDRYKESAERMIQLINAENESFSKQLDALKPVITKI